MTSPYEKQKADMLFHLSNSVAEIGNALSQIACARDEKDEGLFSAFNKVVNARKSIEQCLNSVSSSKLSWTKEEASLSGILHTALRKADDSPAGTLLYRWININKGIAAWNAYVKELMSMSIKQKDKHIVAARRAYDESVWESSPDSDFFLALEAWEGFDDATLNEWIQKLKKNE